MQDAFKPYCSLRKGIDMARRLLDAISSALTTHGTGEKVHFHGGANGAYVCDDPRCVSPHLDPAAR
jgi:hypothetical protein